MYGIIDLYEPEYLSWTRRVTIEGIDDIDYDCTVSYNRTWDNDPKIQIDVININNGDFGCPYIELDVSELRCTGKCVDATAREFDDKGIMSGFYEALTKLRENESIQRFINQFKETDND